MANDPENAPIGEDRQLDSLEDRIASARKAEDDRVFKEHGSVKSGPAVGMQVAQTMVGYPLGGIVVGLVLDHFLHTLPWITIGLMFAAFAGACLHVVQINKSR